MPSPEFDYYKKLFSKDDKDKPKTEIKSVNFNVAKEDKQNEKEEETEEELKKKEDLRKRIEKGEFRKI